MCGIVGYIGSKEASAVLMEGLERLSYRGYDSAGVAVMEDSHQITVRKTKGKLTCLREVLSRQPVKGRLGIGHTRWATHGEPSDLNAHPHTDVQGGIAVVHNGIIENHDALRKHLQSKGVTFVSQTDTEVIAHLLEERYDGDMLRTLLNVQNMLEGSYAIGVICDREPGKLFCVRRDSPLVAGWKGGEGFIASDIPALLKHTRDVVYLQEKEAAVLTENGMELYDEYGSPREIVFQHLDWDLESAEKGGFAHFMLKEIHEQPSALQRTFAPRSNTDEWLPLSRDEACELQKITIVACGTAYHAGVLGKYILEQLSKIPVEVDIASEYRYRQPVSVEKEVLIAISQSGETADTLAAVRLARSSGVKVMAICNVVGSSIVREVGEMNALYTYAGPEIAVASTKAYSTQAEMLVMIALALGKWRGSLTEEQAKFIRQSLMELPALAQETLGVESHIQQIASRMCSRRHVFFVGRGMDYALSMEAALKLKEVSYIFSEAYAAGELKHGPIALLEAGRLVVACITQPKLADKMLANLQEVRARKAEVLAVCTAELAEKVRPHADELIIIPSTHEALAPLLAAIPMQLFAYCMAVARGCDVDQPRNLAKSVTVE